jgi:zinc and cadmium transporter
MVLLNKGASRMRVLLVQLGCVLMVPVGCIAFELTQGASLLGDAAIGAVVALSAGMFLYVALADLLPEVQFQHQHRLELSLSLLAALTLMAAVTGLEDHTGHQHAPRATSEDHTGHQH